MPPAHLEQDHASDANRSAGMVRLQGGSFMMGSDHHYPEEGPAREVVVDDFWIDPTPVTNAQFAAFADDTGYVTFAEKAPDPAHYPGMPPEMARAGSLLFMQPPVRVSLSNPGQWWQFAFGADWRHPAGPGSDIFGLDQHPVVHIAYEDAVAYADWAGKALPTEAQWEYAARGGLAGAAFAWGDQLEPQGAQLANYWRGEFPWQDLNGRGSIRTTAVGAFPANGFGLSDMIGNVWEWTSDWYADRHPATKTKACCIPRNPRGADENASYDPCTPDIRIGRRVLKGGSHLCAPNYCQRYRPAARYAQPVDTSTSHVGFRCARPASVPLETAMTS